MRVLVYGAGAIGCLVGGRLAAAGSPVTLLGRPWLAQQLARAPLEVLDPYGRLRRVHGRPRVITGLAEWTDPQPPDLVILTVKSFDTDAALEDLSRRFPDRPCVLSLQNGVGNEERIAAWTGLARAYAGTITLSAEGPAEGRVRVHNRGGIGLAALADPGDPLLARLAAHLREAGFEVRLYRDWLSMKWSKLCLNLLGNAVGAVLDLPAGAVFGDPRLFHVERLALLETATVMAALGADPVRLPGGPVPLLLAVLRYLPEPVARRLLHRRVARGRGDKLPSLLVDMRRGRTRTEARWLNGAVAEAGRRLGVPTPVNATLAGLVEALASGALPRDAFAGRPDSLLEHLRANAAGA